LFLQQTTAYAQLPRDTIKINDNKPLNFTEHLYFYKTKGAISPQYLINQVPSTKFYKIHSQNTITWEACDSVYWMVFTIKNNTERDLTYYFKLNNPALQLAKLYCKNNSDIEFIGQAGLSIPFNKRIYNHSDIVFPLLINKNNTHTYFCFIDGKKGVKIMPQLQNEDEFKKVEFKQYLILALFTSFIALNFILNLLLFWFLKNKANLFYCFYLVGLLFLLYATQSYDFQYFFGNTPLLANVSIYLASGLSAVAMSYLIIPFLELTPHNTKFLKSIYILRWVSVTSTLMSFVIYFLFSNYPSIVSFYVNMHIIILFVFLVLLFLTGVERSLQKYKPAWFYLIAIVYFAFASTEYAIFLSGIAHPISMHNHPNNLEIGVILDTVIIFFGIIYQYNIAKKKNDALVIELAFQQKHNMEQVIISQEEERQRIAQDLHDDLGSTLSTLMLHISNLNNKTPIDEETNLHYETSINLSAKAINDLKAISYNLLPKDFSEKGLFEIISNRINDLNNLPDIKFILITDGDDKQLSPIASITIYRITTELINNALKHSFASVVTVQILLSNIHLVLMAEDNGIGMNTMTNKTGAGIKNILSRVNFLKGTMNIDTNKKGTTVIIEIPIDL
jgi:signal transduction histidine kinase